MELNEELPKHNKTNEKLELIDGFTDEELKSNELVYETKEQLLSDILDDFIVGANEKTAASVGRGKKFSTKFNKSIITLTTYDQDIGTMKKECLSIYTLLPFSKVSYYYEKEKREIVIPAIMLTDSKLNESLYLNHYKENEIVTDENKDALFDEFVIHFLPSGFFHELVSVQQIIVTIIILALNIITAGAIAAVLEVLAAASIIMNGAECINAIQMIISASNLKEAATTTKELKEAAKLMASGIAKFGVNIVDIFTTALSKHNAAKKNINQIDIDEYVRFKNMSYEAKIKYIKTVDNDKLYDIVSKTDSYQWITEDYNLITSKNIKDIILVRNNGDLNLDWPKYAGLQLETVCSIGDMNGKIFVSRSGSESGKTLGYGETIDAWYVSNSKRSIPSSGSEIQVGVMDVDKYKKVIEIISSFTDDIKIIEQLKTLNITKRNALELISDYNGWSGNRIEVFGKNGILEGLESINKSIDSSYGYMGKVAPWSIGDLKMEGGAGQLNTAFSWKLLIDSGIISGEGTVFIK